MSDIREKLFTMRSYTPIPFLVAGLVFGNPTIVSLLCGIALAALGLLGRFWAVGHAHYETRATSSVGAPRLVTTGPFGLVRNPLYVSNIALYTGFALMADILWLTIATLIWFIIQYVLIVSREEEFLEKEFGQEYEDYRQNVPAFFPRLTPWHKNADSTIDTKIAWKSERRTHQAFAIATVLMVARFAIATWL